MVYSLAVQTDISRKTDVNNLVQKVVAEFGVIDILVNNAGIIISITSARTPMGSAAATFIKGCFGRSVTQMERLTVCPLHRYVRVTSKPR